MAEYLKRFFDSLNGPRNGVPKQVRDTLAKYGMWNVIEAKACRTPLSGSIFSVIKTLSFGNLDKVLSEGNYDTLYHLYIMLTINDGGSSGPKIFLMEKNQVVELYEVSPDFRSEGQCQDLFFTDGRPFHRLAELLSFGYNWQLNNLRDKPFWRYDARDNNCQVFVTSIIKGNDMRGKSLDQKSLLDFINQDVKDLLYGPLFSFAKGITDIAATADIILHGKGLY